VIYGLPSVIPFLIRRFGRTPTIPVFAPLTVVATIAAACAVLSVILLVVAMRLFEREKLVLS
jgi:hypothetical protein